MHRVVAVVGEYKLYFFADKLFPYGGIDIFHETHIPILGYLRPTRKWSCLNRTLTPMLPFRFTWSNLPHTYDYVTIPSHKPLASFCRSVIKITRPPIPASAICRRRNFFSGRVGLIIGLTYTDKQCRVWSVRWDNYLTIRFRIYHDLFLLFCRLV